MGRKSTARHREPGSGRVLSRRNIVKGAVGVAGAGAAGAVIAKTASSALASGATVEPGALTPAVVQLTDAAMITVDASLGNDFRVTIAGDRTMASPVNAENGQQIIFQVTQGSGGPFTLTWDSGYEFSSDLPQPALSTGAGQTDLLGFVYNGFLGAWLMAAFVNGFA
jgi:hypothetical protein